MSKKKRFDIDELISADQEQKRERKKRHHETTLREYLDLVMDDPSITESSSRRLKRIFTHHGFVEAPEDMHPFGVEELSNLVENRFRLYGPAVHRATKDFYNWLGSGSPTEQMCVVFVGPTASGKSSWVIGLMRELERYDLKPIYAIKGCPEREEPLNAIPRYMRRSHFDPERAAKARLERPIEDELGIADIKHDLCPHCRNHFLGWEDAKKNWHKGKYVDDEDIFNWWNIEVETISFSVQGGTGIGSFEPSGEKAQDETDLTAKKRMAVIENPSKGPNSPDAYSYSGELFKGNRGITEGREIFKPGIDDKILWLFINVAAEQQVKIQGSTLPHVFVDTVVIGHCNLNGYKDFANNRGQEGMHSRFYVIPFPYPLRVKDEVRIYRKLINQDKELDSLKRAHIAPGALELAALAVVMSRYVVPKSGIGLVNKAKAYNGEKILTDLEDDEKNPITVEDLVEEGESQRHQDIAKMEGMFGIDSRDALSALNVALAEESSSDNGCLTPLRALRAMRKLFDHRMGHDPEVVENFINLLTSEEGDSVVAEYYDFVKDNVGRAYLSSYDDQAKEMFERYMEEIKYYIYHKNPSAFGGKAKLRKDPVTGKIKEPDEKFMKSIEKHFPVSDGERDIHRSEVLMHKSVGSEFSYETYEPLRKAIEKKILKDAAPLFRSMLSRDNTKDDKAKKGAKDLFKALIDQGFCEVCAKETIDQAPPLFES